MLEVYRLDGDRYTLPIELADDASYEPAARGEKAEGCVDGWRAGRLRVLNAGYRHMLAGELPRIIEYCKLDTVETLLAFLAFAHHTGDVSEEELRRYVESVAQTNGTPKASTAPRTSGRAPTVLRQEPTEL